MQMADALIMAAGRDMPLTLTLGSLHGSEVSLPCITVRKGESPKRGDTFLDFQAALG